MPSVAHISHYLSWPATVELSLPRRLLPNIHPNRFTPFGNRLDETEIDPGLPALPTPNESQGLESSVFGLFSLGLSGEIVVRGLSEFSIVVGDRTITDEPDGSPGPPTGERGENIPILPWTNVSSDGLSPCRPPPTLPPLFSAPLPSNTIPSKLPPCLFSPFTPTSARSRNSSENLASYPLIKVS
jgi:hypothetical protein